MNVRIEKGKKGEFFVAHYLTQQGYTILRRNYRFATGEIDLIAKKGDTLAFVEVKLRKNPLIDPAEIITVSKQRKIISVAKLFIAQHTNEDYVCRFDVALVEEDDKDLKVRYITDAFSAFD